MGQEDFSVAAHFGADVLRRVQGIDWPERILININFPGVPVADVAGVRVTKQGFRDYGNIHLVKRIDPRGFPYFWHGFGREVDVPGHETDLKAMHERCVSVTPLHLDMTHRPTLAALREAFAG